MTAEPSIGQLVRSVLDNVSGLIRGEIDLLKAQAKGQVSAYGIGAGLLAGASFFGIFAFGWLLIAGYQGLATVLQPWASALIVAGALLLLTAVLVALGIRKIKNPPEITVKENIQKDITAIKEGSSL